jgi:hypothetical protein
MGEYRLIAVDCDADHRRKWLISSQEDESRTSLRRVDWQDTSHVEKPLAAQHKGLLLLYPSSILTATR